MPFWQKLFQVSALHTRVRPESLVVVADLGSFGSENPAGHLQSYCCGFPPTPCLL